jgi:hypothetical protein
MCDVEELNAMVGPYQSELLRLYYFHVHPTLPIIESRSSLEAAISTGSVPTSLVVAIYCIALSFWDASPTLRIQPRIPREPLYDSVFKLVALEARTPSLRTIQAILIYLHTPPTCIREPNHPGFWALTCQVSGTSATYPH